MRRVRRVVSVGVLADRLPAELRRAPGRLPGESDAEYLARWREWSGRQAEAARAAGVDVLALLREDVARVTGRGADVAP